MTVVGTWNQKPSRTERDVVSLVKTKCHPRGKSLKPRNWAVVVKERRSIPQRIPGGSPRRRTAAVKVVSMIDAKNGKFQVSFAIFKYDHIKIGQTCEERPASGGLGMGIGLYPWCSLVSHPIFGGR